MKHIHPLQPIGVIVLIAVLWYLRRRKTMEGAGGPAKGPGTRAVVVQKAPKPQDPPEVVYMNLRRKALATDHQTLGLAGHLGENEPYGLLMELGIPNSVVTLACFADGDARVYYQTGGGMIGGIAHESVRKAAKELVALSRTALPRMSRTTSHPLPGPDRVQFYVLTPRGTFTAETDRRALAQSQNDFSSLFYRGQEVVTQMREVQEQRAH